MSVCGEPEIRTGLFVSGTKIRWEKKKEERKVDKNNLHVSILISVETLRQGAMVFDPVSLTIYV